MSGAISAIGNIFNPKVKSAPVQGMPQQGFQTKLAARQEQRKQNRERKGRDATIKTAGMYSGSNLGGTSGSS